MVMKPRWQHKNPIQSVITFLIRGFISGGSGFYDFHSIFTGERRKSIVSLAFFFLALALALALDVNATPGDSHHPLG